MSGAERLREAAKWMRRRAERAPEGPYGMVSQWTTPHTMLSRVTAGGGKVIAEVRERSDFNGVYTVDYFSTMPPAVALAVADWLEATAQRIDEIHDSLPFSAQLTLNSLNVTAVDQALAVADAYLGSPS